MSQQSISRRGLVIGGSAAITSVAAAAVAKSDLSTVQPSLTTAQTRSTSGELSGKVAFVTGAARGIGRAIAVALAKAGAEIAAVDILEDIPDHSVPMAKPADMAETQQLVEQTGRQCVTLKADIRDLSALREAVDQINSQLGPIDIAIANAGVNSNVGFLTEDDRAWQNHWNLNTDVNIHGAANNLRAVLPLMAARLTGRMIIISSTFGRQGNGSNPAYVASKWALVGLTKAAAIELGEFGVTVNAIAPTAVRTGLGGPRTPEQRAQADEWLQANYHQLPIGILEPEDVAGAAVFLASPAAQYVTGATLDVSAGAGARYTA